MALRRKENGIWYTDIVTPDGNRIRQSTGTRNKEQALELHDRLKADFWRQSRLQEKPDRPWKEAVVKYLEEKKHKLSIRNDHETFRWLDKYFGKKLLSEITRDEIHRVRDIKRQESSPTTANRMLQIVRALMRKAEREWEWIERAPAVQLFPEPKRRIRWLFPHEAELLIRELPEYLAYITRFALATGLRESNILTLEWSQVDLSRKVAWVHADMTKNRRAIAVPLNADAVDVVSQQIGKNQKLIFTYRGRALSSANNKTWRAALKRVAIEDFRFHDLRHTWASWHVQAGTPLHVLQELGGWESAEMVRRYAHLGGQQLAGYADNVCQRFGNISAPPKLARG
ncbi:MAG: site-specific integrase [Magnetococcales bacterium]|nr:site-specific integrase [Magnetococcales bacterium]